MDYFKRLLNLLQLEREEDRRQYEKLTATLSIAERRANGMTWYPVSIKDTEISRGDYLTVEVERHANQDILHQFRFGMSAALFSNHDPKTDRVEGTITYISGDKLKITLRTDELPEWSRDGKLGIDAIFDVASYEEMERALKLAPLLAEKKEEGHLIKVLTGQQSPSFNTNLQPTISAQLNAAQQAAVTKIIQANELAIVHGPPGTGKTTTLVQAVKAMLQHDGKQLLVVAPSNAAVDLLTEKLSDEGLNVVRVGNPARVSDRLMSLTLDSKMAAHPHIKELKKLKKRAAEFRDLAHKYKRNFGKEEREQRKALFAEARNISREVENGEQYIIENVLSSAQVITATLVGASHYTVRHLKYHTVVIDEAGQALEPASWIPILKAKKVVLAGDHCQLPPTIKSAEAAKERLSTTLLQKCVHLHPEAVVLLEEQYRMHETIMGYSSLVFYDNKLQAHSTVAQRLLFPEDAPLAFIDTAGCGFEEKWEDTSISNPEEASFLLKHLNALYTQLSVQNSLENFPSIAVISPYKHQVEVLKQQLQHWPNLLQLGDKISVNTIDSFQGQERDVVYISMARSNADNIIGFLSEIRRMNVAMTRAKKKLVVVGDSATLSQEPFYADFIAYAQEKNAYQSAWEFMDV
jgi:ATP-dependent RNA/DNA helicase IGHMBP2